MSKWLRLRILRWRAKNLAEHINWGRETLASGQIELRKCEDALTRLQGEIFLLERPGNIISNALRRNV